MNQRHCSFFIIAYLMSSFAVLCGGPRGLIAEEYVVYGLPLEVQKVTPIDDKQVVIVVRGRERIVAPERVNATLLQYAMAAKDTFGNLSEGTLLSAIRQALGVNDVDSGVELLFFYLNNPSYDMASKRENIAKLFEQTLSVELFQKLLTSQKKKLSEELVLFSLAQLTVYEPAWVQERFSQLLVRNEKLYLPNIEEVIRNLLLSESEPATAEQLIQTIRNLYTPSHPDVQRLELFVSQYEALGELEPSLDRSLLYPFLESSSRSEGVAPLRLLVIEKVHQFAAYAIEKGLSLSALLLLAELQPHERSERTQQLLVTALLTLDLHSPAVEERDALLTLLREESDNSPLVRRESNAVLMNAIESSISEKDTKSAARFRKYVTPQTEQERERYTALAIDEARLLLAMGKKKEARELVEQQGRLSVINRGRLYLADYYGKWPRFAGVLVCIFSLLGFFLFVRSKTPLAFNKSHRMTTDDSELVAEMMNAQSDSLLTSTAPPQALVAEYEALLGAFALERNPTEEALRAAYRKAIKRVHPDLQPKDVAPAEGSDAFLKVSADYERLLELRGKVEHS